VAVIERATGRRVIGCMSGNQQHPDRDLRFISRTFPLWVAVGLALPFGLASP
jgi:hypothetical protein